MTAKLRGVDIIQRNTKKVNRTRASVGAPVDELMIVSARLAENVIWT